MDSRVESFLKAEAFGVVGASAKPEKYGFKVLRCYIQNGRTAIPVNPVEKEIQGVPCVASVADLPPEATSISIITPPPVTEKVVEEAVVNGISNVWMQPGAQSEKAIETCLAHGVNVIADGSCILVVMGYRE